jgi:hypothetical protein
MPILLLVSRQGEQIVRQFGHLHGHASLADSLVKELGFQTSGWGWTPMSVDPEKLLGKPAPDFTLEALEHRGLISSVLSLPFVRRRRIFGWNGSIFSRRGLT